MEWWTTKIKNGQSLVEIIVAMALAALLLPALLTGLVAAREGKAQQIQRTEATAYLIEAQEAMRSIRELGWSAISTNGIYHPVISGSAWALASGSQTINEYQRSIEISDVRRNSAGDIVQSGGNLDPSTRRIDINVSWISPLPTQITSTAYLTRYLDNLVFIQTTETEFNTGDLGGTAVVNNAGGEVILGSGGQGNWCGPDLTLGTLDLPKNGVANALTAIEGQAFAGTGENASGVSFAKVNISNSSSPTATIDGTFDGFKTNAVFGEEGFAYLATDNNSKEIEIINISSVPYTEAGFFNGSGSTNANSIYVSGNVGYMTQGNIFRTFDLASKSGSRPGLGNLTLAGVGTKVIVVGTYAYVSISGNTSVELQIIDVTNPASLTVVGQADVNSAAAQDVYVNTSGTRAYLATAASASQSEMFIIDVTTKTGNRGSLGSYEANGLDAKGVSVVPGNRAIIVGSGGEEYQVINISNEASLVRCGGLNIDVGVNGIASVLEQDGDAYSYIITGDATSELKIIEGGPGGQYGASGTYESATFNPGYQTAFNRFFVSTVVPAQTALTFQVAVADSAVGDCSDASFVFVGPDTTSASFFTTGSPIPLDDDGVGYENPGRCFRYRAYFETDDINYTPEFSDILINYSP